MSSHEDVMDALLKFKRAHGQPAMRQLLERVANVSAMSAVPNEKYEAVIAACARPPQGGSVKVKAADDADDDFDFDDADEDKTPATLDPVKIYARWNSAGRNRRSAE